MKRYIVALDRAGAGGRRVFWTEEENRPMNSTCWTLNRWAATQFTKKDAEKQRRWILKTHETIRENELDVIRLPLPLDH